MDPDWATRLKKDFGLAGAASPGLDEPLSVSGGITPPGQEQSATDAELQSAIDRSRLMQAQRLAQTDPKAAAQLAQQITDPGLRSTALVSSAPAFAEVDATQAEAWVSGARKQLDTMPADIYKLQLMIALSKFSIAKGNRDDARQEISRAYDLGEELFQEDMESNPGKLSDTGQGYDELVDLTAAASREPWLAAETLDHVRHIRNDVLRAHLLVEEAKGMIEGHHTSG